MTSLSVWLDKGCKWTARWPALTVSQLLMSSGLSYGSSKWKENMRLHSRFHPDRHYCANCACIRSYSCIFLERDRVEESQLRTTNLNVQFGQTAGKIKCAIRSCRNKVNKNCWRTATNQERTSVSRTGKQFYSHKRRHQKALFKFVTAKVVTEADTLNIERDSRESSFVKNCGWTLQRIKTCGGLQENSAYTFITWTWEKSVRKAQGIDTAILEIWRICCHVSKYWCGVFFHRKLFFVH